MKENGQLWLEDFLVKRDLKSPNGMELYRYRTSEKEFLKIETILRNWLEDWPHSSNLADLSDTPLFAQLFVLYASEWWRRRYDGTGVAWEPIIADLRCSHAAWSPQQRSRCVESGLIRWRCSVRQQGAYRFILSIALQGGLPMRLLAEGRGRLGKLLKRILYLCSDIAGDEVRREATVCEQDIYGWIESLQKMLPKSFRQPVIFYLLTEIIITVLRLKIEAKLEKSEEALQQLDHFIPGWRNQFPLPLEDDHAQGLIAQLLRDAAEVTVAKTSVSPFIVERTLENDNGEWRLVSSIILPESIETARLAEFFSVDVQMLPRQADLSLTAGEKVYTAKMRRIAGKESFRMMRHFPDILDLSAGLDHVMQIDQTDGNSWCGMAHRGDELDDDLPWVFSARSGHLFIKQGSGKIAEPEAQIVVPAHWQIETADEQSSCTLQGELRIFNRAVWQIRGKIQVTGAEGERFNFQTGRADAAQLSYFWKGEPLWLDFRSPARAFRGLPKLLAISAEGVSKEVGGKPEFTVLGSKGLNVNLGPVLGQYREGKEIQCRARMVLLPGEACVDIQGNDALSGTVHLHHWGCSQARTLTPGVRIKTEKEDHSFSLHASLESNVRTPQQIELELFWPHSTTPARLAMPYPAKGARAFSIDGEEWSSGSRISLMQLLGARIAIHAPSYSHAELVLRSDYDNSSRTFSLSRAVHSSQMLVRLHHFEEPIHHMLSMSNKLDTRVAVTVILDGGEIFSLLVSRYQGHLKPDMGLACLNDTTLKALDHETLGRIRVLACNLVSNGTQVVELEQRTSEGIHVGIWPFGEDDRDAGPWLLYPHEETPVALRPLLMTVPGKLPDDEMVDRGLAGILCKWDERLRMVALTQFVEEIAGDYLHQGWEEVEQWAARFGHLSLTSFDLWRVFAGSASGMAALAYRLGDISQNFLQKFAIEMPFCWTTISYRDWKLAMVNLRNQCEQIYSSEIWQAVFTARLSSVGDKFTGEYPELRYLLGLASANFDENGQQMVVGLQFGIGPQAENDLFQGETCKKQQLFHRHADEEWPGGLQDVLRQARNHPVYSRYICSTRHGFKDPVINLPLLLAVQCASGDTGEWFKNRELISMLQHCRAFDLGWFEEAFNSTIARCLADNFLQL